uniref:secretion/conjugation apparatus DotM-related subunit n=1 Tax=Piscirickettsia litoralis TaxID=1891921 RepID=UPI001F17038E|nr:hypothetical protein [Piscirickettsia litoralis]
MQQNEQGGVPHVVYYTLAVVIFLCVLFIGFHDEVVQLVLSFKLFEIELTQLMTGKLDNLAIWIRKTPAEAVTGHDLYTISVAVGSVIRWFILPLALLMIILLWKLHPGNKLSTIHSMNSLLDSMKSEFPETMPIVNQRLAVQSIDEGGWRMALTPIEFMKKHQLFAGKAAINHDRAHDLFIAQLGPSWQEEKLTAVEKAVFGILAAFACYDRAIAEKAAREISASSQKEVLNYSLALQLFNRYKSEKIIKK